MEKRKDFVSQSLAFYAQLPSILILCSRREPAILLNAASDRKGEFNIEMARRERSSDVKLCQQKKKQSSDVNLCQLNKS